MKTEEDTEILRLEGIISIVFLKYAFLPPVGILKPTSAPSQNETAFMHSLSPVKPDKEKPSNVSRSSA